MEVYLIRHTAVAAAGLCYGHYDVALADTAAAEIAAVAGRRPLFSPLAAPRPSALVSPAELPAAPPPRVISSPASRCQQLARALAPEVGLDERLREMHFGSWEGRPWASIAAEELNPWMADYVALAPPGGETFQQVQDRAAALLAELTAASQPTVLVTHAGLIRAVLCHCLEMPLRHAFRFGIDFGSVSELRWQGAHWQVLGVNR